MTPMAADLTVYRTRRPEALAVALAYGKAFTDWKDRVHQLLDELGFPGRKPFIIGSMLQYRIAGIECTSDEWPPPSGWRVAESDGSYAFIPNKRTKIGKQAASKLGSAAPPRDPRLDLPGMPGQYWVGHRILHPAVQVLEGDTTLYVIWQQAPEPDIDLDIWERVRLSGYYAVLEAEEDASAEAVASHG